ncbi:hypothetical protein Q5H93_21165 [Hymenobacter sp. ASUV-10]|uniref:Outer membrane protein beta-barrel domain-containing protein n=1 Tax=Hymenobacter aranciens TaxID=3063996 RepID=A0ABT9BHT8_9BACT|nr:hypothetical protein [Hymenobacter sp. ASUV-10]MDO7877269.1 hypothetical protein [Hymenobacter sp. ASUV-10]
MPSRYPKGFYRFSGLVASVGLLGGCAVYAPTVPATPVLEKGQVEASLSLRMLIAPEATVAWAPTSHLLVVGEGAMQGSDGSYTTQGQTITYKDYHRQGGLGLGYYRAPTATSAAYLAAVGGVGFASTRLHAEDVEVASPWLPFPFPVYAGEYQASYRRYYGQVYAAWPHPERRVMAGVSLRGTVVDYSSLTLNDSSFTATNRAFLEPSAFVRFGRGPLKFQLTGGFSLPLTGNRNDPSDKRTAPTSFLFSGGLVFRPDLLKKR